LFRTINNRQFSIYHHIVRRRIDADLDADFPDPVSRAIDQQWLSKLRTRKLFSNELFISVVFRPARGKRGMLTSLRSQTLPQSVRRAQNVRALNAVGDQLLAAFRGFGIRHLGIESGTDVPQCAQLAMLSRILHGDDRPILLPQGALAEYLPFRRTAFAKTVIHQPPAADLTSRVGTVISIKDYPSGTVPGLFDGLLRAPYEFVLTESFQFMERQTAEERVSLSLRRLQTADDDTFSLRSGLQSAKDQLVSGQLGFGEHHASLVVWDGDVHELAHSAAALQSTLADAGIISVREDLNLEPAFWAQFPGNEKYIARKAMISTDNFAGFCSLHAFPSGKREGNYWSQPICLFETTSSTPYYFDFHEGDLGNFLIVGPSGSGKTVYLNFLLAQSRKLRPRIVMFDKDRGSDVFIRAMGGRYATISPGQPTGFNPLALEDTPANRAFVRDWIGVLLKPVQGDISEEDAEVIAMAVDINFSQDPELRCLSVFAELLAGTARPSSGSLSTRMRKWIGHGEHAWLFDNKEDHLDVSAETLGFDMTQVLDNPEIRSPVMMYLFHRIEQRLDGARTIIVIDEGWKALDDLQFQYRLKDWLKTIRKRNGVVGFVTQSLGDALDSPIAAAITEQTAVQMYLPNPRARADEYQGRLALSQHEFQILRALPETSRCVLIKKGRQSIVARLDLSDRPEILKLLSGRESSVRELDAIRAQVGDAPAQWLPIFFSASASGTSATIVEDESKDAQTDTGKDTRRFVA
ncbi:MAG: VirB4 family type IV secretion/conjugal transfer ATPase, partial [Pseudomonadota bacterium]